jgi:hypothetical protein
MAALGSATRCALALAVVSAGACNQQENEPVGTATWAVLDRVCRADAPAVPLATAARDSLPPVGSDHHGRRAALADSLPGRFAGLTTIDGRLALAMTDTSRRREALAYTRAHGIDGTGLTDDTPVRQVRWDYAQLYDWFRYLERRLDAVSGMVSLGIAERDNRIEYGVVSANDRLELEARLRRLDVPCFLVAIALEQRPSVGTGYARSTAVRRVAAATYGQIWAHRGIP